MLSGSLMPLTSGVIEMLGATYTGAMPPIEGIGARARANWVSMAFTSVAWISVYLASRIKPKKPRSRYTMSHSYAKRYAFHVSEVWTGTETGYLMPLKMMSRRSVAV